MQRTGNQGNPRQRKPSPAQHGRRLTHIVGLFQDSMWQRQRIPWHRKSTKEALNLQKRLVGRNQGVHGI